MDRTPSKNYEILEITGDAYEIERRGIDIETLGDEMIAAANLLDTINLGATCRGKSLDAIKDKVGDMTGDLRTAGERYRPSGTAILRYGRALDGVQTDLRRLMPDLEQKWQEYESARGQFAEDSQLPEPEEGQTDDRTTQGDVDGARGEWESLARQYEGVYDTWWGAYEDARNGVKDANDDGVEDSWLDNALPALEVLGDILSYAGIVLAIAACIIGGPFILAAALVGLAALAVTCLKVAGGRGTWVDIAFAAIGVFPFGKAFSAFGAVRAASGMGRLGALGRGLVDMGGDMVGAGWRNGSRLTTLLSSGRTGQVFHDAAGTVVNANGTRVMRNFFRGLDGPSIGQRLLFGGEGAMQRTVSEAASGLSNKATSNLNQFLSNATNGNIMQDMLAGGNGVLDVVDNLGKAGAGFVYDRATGGW
ncbi:hypothetical protein ACIQLK_11750 [Microbacterium sp. NPDC091382]|uniref:hypothetical protein n=1 Tax=Microbacterium sp. NPDC091382 TaxID=3364210 RepID=UPI003829D5ED